MKRKAEITVDENLIAFCGLYCGACPRFLKGKCEGCSKNQASWCKVKPCNIENNSGSCADCELFDDPSGCEKYNPLIIRIGEFVSRTSRRDAIQLLKEIGRKDFAKHMAENRLVSMKK